ncbi:MAG: hypothetical protein ACXAEB_12355 [Candidatus Thorarchaeota archaeon]
MKVRRNWSIALAILSSSLLLCTVFMPIECSATEVWSDDFNDGNYDGWTIEGINMTADPPELIDGNFSVDDGLLRATGENGWNLASHPSTVATGTWMFDIDSVASPTNHYFIFFMSDDIDISEGMPDGYSISIDITPYHDFTGFRIRKFTDGNVVVLGQYDTDQDVIGGYHVDITRNSTGHINVWINGTHRIAVQDDSYSTSGYFRFSAADGPAIDNIVVYNSIEFDPPTTVGPTPTTSPTPTEPGTTFPIEWLVIGISVPVVLIILLVVKRSR